MNRHLRFVFTFFCCLALCVAFACSNNTNQKEPSAEQSNNPNDGGNQPEGNNNNNNETPVGNGKWPPPSGYAAVEFRVDDSVNKTYKDKQLLWNGSFRYDDKTNTIVYASAWQPTDGPFPPLYDDGPINQGGHEPIGATAGDNIFGIVVFIKPDDARDLEFEYGVINEDNNWIWEGPNGSFTIKKGSTDVVKADGLTIKPHGSIDIKITLDVSKLPETFKPEDPNAPPPIFIKGNMTNWGHIQVLDKGKKGDDKEGDGLLTFVQSQNLNISPHMGLLQHKRHVQFVFQFNSVTGLEYKDADDKAIGDGVTAWADCNGDGKFTDDEKQPIKWEKDSRGAAQNTTIIVCENAAAPCTKNDCSTERCKDAVVCKQGDCTDDSGCKADERCDAGKCVPKGAACTKADCATARCKDDPVCSCANDTECQSNESCDPTTKKCVAKEACKDDTTCPPDHTCDTASGRCLLKPCTDKDCQLPRCAQDPVCNSTQKGPVIYFVTPSAGPLAGGTDLTLSGERFQQGAKVQIGGKDATDIKIESDQRLTCKTPAGAQQGNVDVTVINPDGQRNTYPQGFRYDDSAVPTPRVTGVDPARGDVAGGDKVTIRGRNFQSGIKVWFDTSPATNVTFVSATEITCDTPAHAAAKVAVTVENPDTRKDTLLDAFEYYEKNPTADWGRIVSAKTMQGTAGQALDPIYCQVYDASFATKNPGATNGLKAQAGWGPSGTQANAWPAGNWTDSTFNKDVGNNDEYKTTITIPTAGTYNFACRFSLDNGNTWLYADADAAGTNNGYDPNDAGTVTISDANTFSIASVSPAFGLDQGGNTVTIRGGGFQQGVTVMFGTAAGTNVTVKSKTEIEVVTPKVSAGKVDVSVTLSGNTQTLTGGFTFTGLQATVGWCKIQWPPKMPDSANSVPAPQVGSPSPTIYGHVYKQGVTDKAGAPTGLIGHVGYGPTGTDPAKDAGWRWFPASYNAGATNVGANNKEFSGNVTPHAAGSYDYAFRFSGDGVNFWYCDLDGNDDKTNYRTSKAGKMTAQ